MVLVARFSIATLRPLSSHLSIHSPQSLKFNGVLILNTADGGQNVALLQLFFGRELNRSGSQGSAKSSFPVNRASCAAAAADVVVAAADDADAGGAVGGVDCSWRQKLASAAAGRQYNKPVFGQPDSTFLSLNFLGNQIVSDLPAANRME